MSDPVRLLPLYRHILGIYRAKAGPLFALAAILFVPLSVLDLAATALPADVDSLSGAAIGGLILLAVVRSAAALLGTIFYSGAVSSIVLEPRLTRARVIEIARALPYGRLIAIDVLFYLGVFAGLLLLVIPGLVFFTYFALAAAAAELENRGVRAGMRRSRELVRGRFWKVMLVVVPIALVPELFAGIAVGLGALADATTLAGWLGRVVAEVAFTPLFAVAAVVLLVELAAARGESLPGASTSAQRRG